MAIDVKAVWHKISWDGFLQEKLPRLLADRLTLEGYRVEAVDDYCCRLHLAVQGAKGTIEVVYDNVPLCDEWGRFQIDGHFRTVVPVPTEIDLARADILCVGEQVLDFLNARIGDVPSGLQDADAVRVCLPLAGWLHEFFIVEPTSQYLQLTNELDMHTHLRRISLFLLLGEATDTKHIVHPSQQGRVCLFCTPEGPNISRIFEVALGAAIRDGKLVIIDDAPEMGLGMNASMIPFIEHNDTNRTLMGVNMARQWIGVSGPSMPRDRKGIWHDYQAEYDGVKPETEPALVQTGCELDDACFWKGYNLLTAFMSWDGDTFEDGLVMSESAAKKMTQPRDVAVGDKLSNRHGMKGVISRILPDDEMPKLADGTPVELIVSLCSLPSRLNIGQVREAVMGRVAKAEGAPVIVPPLHAPKDDEIRARLKANGLPEDGMEQLTRKGKALAWRTTVGWVYWGRTLHVAHQKIRFGTQPDDSPQHLGEMEFWALREAGADVLVNEFYNTCAADSDQADTLAERVATGSVLPAGRPSSRFGALVKRLNTDGVNVSMSTDGATFSLQENGNVQLARPVPHPWLSGRMLSHVGSNDSPESDAVIKANARLEQMISNAVPQVLIDRAAEALAVCVQAFYDALLKREHLRFDTRVLFSGRSVIAPNKHFRYDQVGVPEDMAWVLYGPFVAREMGSDVEVKKRSKKAAKVLDDLMARMWIVSHRAPAVSPTVFLAYHGVRVSGDAIQVPILVTRLMNADFDGDQMALYLPVTDEGQKAAANHLSVVAHLTRDPDLIARGHMHLQDALFGLACLSRTEDGMQALSDLVGEPLSGQFLDKTQLYTLLERVMADRGIEAMLDLFERLKDKGFEVAQQTGASMGAFLGASMQVPEPPEGDGVAEWQAYVGELVPEIFGQVDYDDDAFGAVALLVECGARGNWEQLRQYLAPQGLVHNVHGERVPVRHHFRVGLTPQELFTRTVGARLGLANTLVEMTQVSRDLVHQSAPSGYGVLSRARRSESPGVVFARAALKGEVDPLTDDYSRLFVGR